MVEARIAIDGTDAVTVTAINGQSVTNDTAVLNAMPGSTAPRPRPSGRAISAAVGP